MEKCSSTCNAHTPARGRKGKHHVPRGGALCPEGNRNPEVSKKSSKWCDLHFSQHLSVEGRGYGQGEGARLPETDRVIWQTARTRQWQAELERTGTGHGSSLHKTWGLTQCLERPREGPRGPCQGRCKRDNLGESCQNLCWFLQAVLLGLGRFYTHSLVSASQQPQGLGPSSFQFKD